MTGQLFSVEGNADLDPILLPVFQCYELDLTDLLENLIVVSPKAPSLVLNFLLLCRSAWRHLDWWWVICNDVRGRYSIVCHYWNRLPWQRSGCLCPAELLKRHKEMESNNKLNNLNNKAGKDSTRTDPWGTPQSRFGWQPQNGNLSFPLLPSCCIIFVMQQTVVKLN